MWVTITITAGASISNTLEIRCNLDWDNPITGQEAVLKSSLVSGYTFEAPPGATQFKVVDTGSCLAETDILVCNFTTTEEPAITTSSEEPVATTTTTAIDLTHFWMSYGSYTSTGDICTDDMIIWMDAWHDGSHPYPDTSDRVYTDEAGMNLLEASGVTTYWAYSPDGGESLPEGYFSLTPGLEPVQDFAPC